LYADSTASGHARDFDGIETGCGAGACAAGDLVAVPSGTYQGLATTLAQAGSWSSDMDTPPNATIDTDWPDGYGDPEYGYHSPKLVNWSSTAWGTGSTAWEANALRCIRRACSWIRATQGGEGRGKSLFAMLSTDMLNGFKNALEPHKITLGPYKEAEDLGFPDVLNFEGCAIQSEYGCPAQTGYIVDLDDVLLEFLTEEMIKTFDPFRESDMAWKMLALTVGNMTIDVRHMAKLFNYSTAS